MAMKNPGNLFKATPADAETVARIGRETFYETWRPVNTEEDMRQYLAGAFAIEKISGEIASESNTFLLAESENRIVGYAKLRRDRTHTEFGNEKVIELERIYVSGSFQDKKIGKALMDECLAIARKEGYSWFFLGVNIDNARAIAFYKRYGFEIFGTKQFRLGEAVDDDYLMKLKL